MLTLTGPQVAALGAQGAVMRLFITLTARDGGGSPVPAYYWNDVGSILVGGNTYIGSGTLISVNDVQLVSDATIAGLGITLSGFDSNVASEIRGNDIMQAPVSVDMGLFDPDARTIVGSLIPHFRGKVDTCEIQRGAAGDSTSIQLTCECVSRALTIPRYETRTHASEQLRSATDSFYQYTGAQRDKRIFFGTGDPTKAKGPTKKKKPRR